LLDAVLLKIEFSQLLRRLRVTSDSLGDSVNGVSHTKLGGESRDNRAASGASH
jgi:hypothetical protein